MKIEIPAHIRGLIFDCDGTLVDSMPLHMRAWEFALASAGAAWDYDFFFSKKGMQEEDIVDLYNTQFGSALNRPATVQAKHEYFRDHSAEFKPIRHVVDVVIRYKDALPMAVVSGGTRENVHLELDAIGIKNVFKAILTADDNIKPKPAPDSFVEAARLINIQPHLCQVFEDGELGLEAARRAGMLATDIRHTP
jgi:HAD superfamily hydrolase (TIGR01509 family)